MDTTPEPANAAFNITRPTALVDTQGFLRHSRSTER
jgi:hypothetical protein